MIGTVAQNMLLFKTILLASISIFHDVSTQLINYLGIMNPSLYRIHSPRER